jgi:dTDP-4-dehydrorhamnose 3,5-epimerase
MKFLPTRLAGATLIELEPQGDARGWFVRTFCAEEFAAAGLVTDFVQASQSHTAAAGTLRGMHFQHAPHAETKLVRCLRGAIWDVIIDLRPESPDYLKWQGFALDAASGRMLYVPEGFAHGFQTLEDATEVGYRISHRYTPAAAGGLRWDDPAFGIAWPRPVAAISERDAAWPWLDAPPAA